MSKKIINIIKIIKNNKRYKYVFVVTIMLLFISIIGYSLSIFNNNNSTLVANIKVNDLLFNMTTNSGESDDRILRLQAGKTESFYVKLKNLNSIDAKYELKYLVCSDSVCTNTSTTLPDNVKVFVMPNSKSQINGEIASTIIEIELLTLNYNNEDVYIKLDLNAGYVWNDLALQNQFEVSASDGKNQEKNIDIIAYVDGIEAEEYPRTCNYITSIKGYNGDIEVSIPGSYVVCDRKTNTWKMVVDVLVKKVIINFTYKEGAPAFTYTGDFEIANEGTADWKIRLLSSGTFTFTEEPPLIDVFLVGGGGGGGAGKAKYSGSETIGPFGSGGGGGAGGYTKTVTKITSNVGSIYNIVIGVGGTSGQAGGTTSAFTYSVAGGGAGGSVSTVSESTANEGKPGTGGSNGGAGYRYLNAPSINPGSDGVPGQGTTTREFGESTGTLYAGGGAGGRGTNGYVGNSESATGGAGGGGNSGTAGTANTGGGGGGGNGTYPPGSDGASGGSGIVIIRAYKEDL